MYQNHIIFRNSQNNFLDRHRRLNCIVTILIILSIYVYRGILGFYFNYCNLLNTILISICFCLDDIIITKLKYTRWQNTNMYLFVTLENFLKTNLYVSPFNISNRTAKILKEWMRSPLPNRIFYSAFCEHLNFPKARTIYFCRIIPRTFIYIYVYLIHRFWYIDNIILLCRGCIICSELQQQQQQQQQEATKNLTNPIVLVVRFVEDAATRGSIVINSRLSPQSGLYIYCRGVHNTI